MLVTAGGTREPIDAVRVITNRSSGKQGYAVAAEAARRGAKVTLVSTVTGSVPAGVDVVPVETAAEMADAVFGRSDQADVVVMAAAVADFRPVAPAAGKIKKDAGPPGSSSSRRSTSSPSWACASAPARCSSASRPRPTTSPSTPPTSCAASTST